MTLSTIGVAPHCCNAARDVVLSLFRALVASPPVGFHFTLTQ